MLWAKLLFLLPGWLSFAGAARSEIFLPVVAKHSAAQEKLNPARQEDLAKVLDIVSKALLGKSYVLGPLGEGEGAKEDPDPLYRLDAFDCTTFIETVMANAYCFQAKSQMGSCLKNKMRKIRYAGENISYKDRNHIPELDWLPNNTKRGFLEDLRPKLFTGQWLPAAISIDRELWLAKEKAEGEKTEEKKGSVVTKGEHFYLPVSFFFKKIELNEAQKKELDEKLAKAQKEIKPDEEDKLELAKAKFRAELEFLRATYQPIEERLNEIPSGTILNLVRANLKDKAKARLTPLITHQALIIQKNGVAYIRQAAPTGGHVGEQKLGEYLLRYVRSANYRGISLYRIIPSR
ncbi:MAG: N-acetylmuramoyl-L-alanine amidase-like domain-containing protein [Bdellovibrionota bacterium]